MNLLKHNPKKYLPDILFLSGIWIASYNFLRQPVERGLALPDLTPTDYFTEYKVLGIMLVALALNVVVRQYFANK